MAKDPFEQAYEEGVAADEAARQSAASDRQQLEQRLRASTAEAQRKVYEALSGNFWDTGTSVSDRFGNESRPVYHNEVEYPAKNGVVLSVRFDIEVLSYNPDSYMVRQEITLSHDRRRAKVWVDTFIDERGAVKFDKEQFTERLIEALRDLPSRPPG